MQSNKSIKTIKKKEANMKNFRSASIALQLAFNE